MRDCFCHIVRKRMSVFVCGKEILITDMPSCRTADAREEKKNRKEKNARQSRHRSLTQWDFGNKLASAMINTYGYGDDDDDDGDCADHTKKLKSSFLRKIVNRVYI